MTEKLQLTYQIMINPKHKYFGIADQLCFKAKNLRNYALYNIRQHYRETKEHLSYNVINDRFSKENQYDYRAMPYAQCAQQVLMGLDKEYKSFFKAKKSAKMIGKHPRPPKYKDPEKGRYVCTFTNQTFKQKGEHITIKADKDNTIELTFDKIVQQIRIVPRINHYVIELIYNETYELKPDNNRYAAIDLGVNNLATLTSNVAQSVIYDGKPLKSINHFYNKKKAKLQSKLTKNQSKKKYTSKRIQRITHKRNCKVKDYMHKVSKSIIEYLESNNLNTLFVGKNTDWKDGVDLGRKNNQNFVSIPHNMLISMLSYKCKKAGIYMTTVNEAYTSICSFLDNETVAKHSKYKGEREKRGLFISNKKKKINADINGSYNIMRLGIIKRNCDVSTVIPTDMRFVYNPVRKQVA